MKKLFSFLLAANLAFLTSCSSIINSHRQKMPMMQNYLMGNNTNALAIADKKCQRTTNTGDEIVWRLEAGSLNFLLGNYNASIDNFERTEQLIREFDERAIVSLRDLSTEAATAVTNLNALPYRGLCRDRIALSIYKSLAYLGAGREDAFGAQLNRLRQTQEDIQIDYAKYFEADNAQMNATHQSRPDIASQVQSQGTPDAISGNPQNNAFAIGWNEAKAIGHKGYGNFLNPAAIFLSGLGSYRDGNYDNARIDFSRLLQAMPNNPLFKQYYVTSLLKANREIPAELAGIAPFNFPIDQNCVYVIVAQGLTASFQQIDIYFPIMFAFPICEYHPSPFSYIHAISDGLAYQAIPIADMDAIHSEEYLTRLPGILTRTITSTLIKEASYFAALEAIRHSDMDSNARMAAELSVAVGGAAYRIAMNTADTRSWETLPKEFLLTQLPMPSNRNITIQLQSTFTQNVNLTIPENAKSAIVFVNAPTPQNISCQVLPITSK